MNKILSNAIAKKKQALYLLELEKIERDDVYSEEHSISLDESINEYWFYFSFTPNSKVEYDGAEFEIEAESVDSIDYKDFVYCLLCLESSIQVLNEETDTSELRDKLEEDAETFAEMNADYEHACY